MKCYLRQLTCVVSVLILLATASAGVIDEKKVKVLAIQELRKSFGDRVRLVGVRVFISKPISFTGIERKSLNVREGEPRGSFYLYLRTKRGLRRITATLDLRWRCAVLIAQEDIARGERVFPWQVGYKEMYLGRCPRKEISSTEELINYIALRYIKKGERVKKSFLKKEPLIRRGDEVDVVFRKGALEISFKGKALDTGFYGDTIRVKSLNTGKILRGRVISEEAVLVK